MDPISLSSILSGPDFQIAGVGDPQSGSTSSSSSASTGIGSMLADKMSQLDSAIQQADTATQGVVTGQSADIANVVTQVEKASLDLQIASQIRNKAVDAYQDLFRMQI